MHKIYTDGACSAKTRLGGWAFVIWDQENLESPGKILSGHEKDTTNNRMELMAVIQALEYYQACCKKPATLYADSLYVVDGVNKYMPGWKEGRWQDNHKKVPNLDLWLELDKLLTPDCLVEITWTRGHAGDAYNELADRLAVLAAEGVVLDMSGTLNYTI